MASDKEKELMPIPEELQNRLRARLEKELAGAFNICAAEIDRIAAEAAKAEKVDATTAAHVRAWAYFSMVDTFVDMRRRGAFSFGVSGPGDCFEAALMVMSLAYKRGMMTDIVLVHGEMQFKSGRDFHAWLELGDVVIDPSNYHDRTLICRKEKYYKDLGVDPRKQHRYNALEAKAWNEKTGSLGPWEHLPV